MQTNQKPLQTAFVYGIITGAALGIGEVALGLLLFWAISMGMAGVLLMFIGRSTLVLLVLAYLYAGYGAARRTGTLFAGTLAGALTGVFGVATIIWLSYLASFLHMSLQLDPQTLGLPLAGSSFFLLASPLVRIMLTFAVYGAIVGTVGGLIGKRRHV